MARIFITGSADGLGQMAATALIKKGHDVILHARNERRAEQALLANPGAETVLIGDLSNTGATIRLADSVNGSGQFDAVIHNAGVYRAPADELVNVNTVAPYLLTILIKRPKRLIYLSSGMQAGGEPKLEALRNNHHTINYSDTKLQVLMLCKAIARYWPDVYANAVDPGWVPTKMGGKGAPDNLDQGYETQVWLADGRDRASAVSGKYFYHMKEESCNPRADDEDLQDKLVEALAERTGVSLKR
ncbi:SDR family NAD(P)-dependent oxidoreductase [Pedobacter sp. SYP-B3415]|uniref:SDR family NAD(P)-dependent oxidoreductase n=1 Tax=Pedobacter sp. SYP-B3415 TaxID=2496641 RepID=UPI00101D2885|nr:SDR family NAD(P)-dependent oxidoreductase [Pedobacter sp. SYP-B3415]